MSKIEKTLELNITHEILSLTESFRWNLAPIHLRKYWHPYSQKKKTILAKPYALGLYISQEGRKGGGWDVSINSPSMGSRNPRILYIQFKAGERKEFCDVTGSKFYGSKINTSPCVEFEFGKKKQHLLLQELTNKSGNKDAVIYAFPRMVDRNDLIANIGKLLLKTTFVSVKEMDAEAKLKSIDLADGNTHKFRACYNDPYKYEINLLLLLLEGQYDFVNVISELIAIRVMRTFDAIQESFADDDDFIYTYNIAEAFANTIQGFADYLGIDSLSNSVANDLKPYSRIYKYLKINQPSERSTQENFLSENFLNTVIKTLKPYFELTKENTFYKSTKVPEAPMNYTFELNTNIEMFFGNDFELENFEGITYNIF